MTKLRQDQLIGHTLGILSVLLLGIIIVACIARWWPFPDRLVIYSMAAVPKSVQQTDFLKINIDMNVLSDTDITVQRRLISMETGVEYLLDSDTQHHTLAGKRTQVRALDLPVGIPVGDYRYFADMTYQVSPLQTRTQRTPDANFTITKNAARISSQIPSRD